MGYFFRQPEPPAVSFIKNDDGSKTVTLNFSIFPDPIGAEVDPDEEEPDDWDGLEYYE